MIGLGLDADGVGGSAPIVRQHPRHRGREKCRLIVVRFETSQCDEECVVVFFLNEISESTLLGVSALPAYSTLSDVSISLCDHCGRLFLTAFVRRAGPETLVGLAQGLLVLIGPS
jgi:hypothetical protein